MALENLARTGCFADDDSLIGACDDMPAPLGRLLELWRDKRAGRRMPARGDFNVFELSPWLGSLHLIAVEIERFRFCVFASGAALRFGDELTGRYLDEARPPELVRAVSQQYRQVVREGRPFYKYDHGAFGDRLFAWHKLICPLSDDGRRVSQLFVGLDWDGPRDRQRTF